MICQKCVMDSTIASFMALGKDGCNYCCNFRDRLSKQNNSDGSTTYQLDTLLNSIKKVKRKRYDCIIGVSGGIDSCFALLKAKEAGLNPLAVHFDNGWNSNLSQTNIENLVITMELQAPKMEPFGIKVDARPSPIEVLGSKPAPYQTTIN